MRFADKLVIYIPSKRIHDADDSARKTLQDRIDALTADAGGCTVVHGHGEYIMHGSYVKVAEPVAIYTWWWPMLSLRKHMPLVHQLIEMGEESVLVEVNHRGLLYFANDRGVVSC